MAPSLTIERSAGQVLHAISQEGEGDFRVMLKTICAETENYLARLSRAAHEGRAVDEANNYLRWLQFSGVLRLLEKYSFVDAKFLKLRPACEELQRICRPWLQNQIPKPSPNLARVDEINDKLDYLLSLIAKPATVQTVPLLQVTQGGSHGR